MRARVAITALLMGLACATVAPPLHAQSLEDLLTQQFQDALQGGQAPDGGTPPAPGLEESPEGGDPFNPTTPAPEPAPDLPAPAATPAPVPPPYLQPGPGAERYPVAAVAQLTEPDASLSPLRAAALIAPGIALLLLALAGLLRAAGLRTAAHEPVDVSPPRGLARLGQRTRQTADDMRDFLRRSR